MNLKAPKLVGIIDYGTGNISSLVKAFTHLGTDTILVSSPLQLQYLDAVILPGVGHYGPASLKLNTSGLREPLISSIRSGLPTLGICLGFQLLGEGSAEAPYANGLGLLPLTTERISPINKKVFKVPHLGWNSLSLIDTHLNLLDGIQPHERLFYYANSYSIPYKKTLSLQSAFYFHDTNWLAMVEVSNVHGVQFHPEKSRAQGLRLLRNFLSF
jgi:imidazole glycerol phosphate synthase glutamine amidotransferase subunit